MPEGNIPEDVLRFIAEQIDTVPHLETLLLLWENPTKRWTAEEIAVRVYVPADRAREILQDLVRKRLAASESTSPPTYAYDSGWDESGEQMARVAQTYRRQLVRVATFIHSKASPAVRDFARAFQFKNDRK